MSSSDASGTAVSDSVPDGFQLPGTTFVLVHGAYHGGWCWRAVARALRERGHSVFTPTLTGLGERRHLMSVALSVDTFVADIANVIDAEDLRDVTLVGHSFGGVVISGVADRVPDRLRRLVYLDAVTPLAGKSLFDMMPDREREARLAVLASRPDGAVQATPPPAKHFGITDAGQAMWVDRRLTAHPVGGFTSPVNLRHPLANCVPAAYIRCIAPVFPINDPCAAFAREQPDWQYREIATGHDAMISDPAGVVRLLLELSGLE